ncbi:MAG: transglycosylase domain-containing protein [Myxococcota bacterium]
MKRILWIGIGSLAALLLAVAVATGVQLAAVETRDLAQGMDEPGPSRVLSRPLVLRRGAQLGADALEAHLIATAHRRVEQPAEGAPLEAGAFAVSGRIWRIGARPFEHPGGREAGGTLEVTLGRSGRVASLRDGEGRSVRVLRLEPVVIASFHPPDGRDRRRVRLEDLPPHLVDAVLAIEDQRFFEHGGLDLRRIAGAMLANLRAGRIVQGGSTLTQQLVKNLFLSRERSLFRKLQEAPLAVLIEWRHSKQEILQAYLNEAYLGQSGGVAIHGVGRAAEHWFGRRVESLALHESALLAGMLRGPSLYSPRRDPAKARARRDLVLAEMREQGSIDEAEYEAARSRDLSVIARRRVPASVRYFTDALGADLAERYPDEQLAHDGLRIHTSIDARLQRLAEQGVASGVERLERENPALVREQSPLQAALVALDARSGQLLAVVGGRDHGRSQFNRATDARRQPGSVFKAVAALAALTPYRGEPPLYTLATLVEDEPITMETPEGDWEPGNHDREFRGYVTLRQVVEHSLNVPMIRVGMELGPRRVVRAARRLGIESPMRGVPSLVLGTSEVTLLEMTRAYGVLAAEGWRADLRPVLEVRAADGEILEAHEPSGARALDPAEAHLVTSVLRGVVDHGTGLGVRARGFSGPVAGKTGTTDDYRDAWFIGYVPDLAVGVWVGFDDGETLRNSGSRAALPIFADFLAEAIGPAGGRPFRVPDGVETATVVAAAGHPSGLLCSGDPEVFLEGTAPRERCNPWGWFAGDRLIRVGDWMDDEDEAEALPEVAAGPERETRRRRPRLEIRLPRWLNPFRRDSPEDE